MNSVKYILFLYTDDELFEKKDSNPMYNILKVKILNNKCDQKGKALYTENYKTDERNWRGHKSGKTFCANEMR